MQKKAQIDIGGMEINPMAAVFGLVGALISLIVMKNVETPVIFRILTPIATFVACYLLTSFQLKD